MQIDISDSDSDESHENFFDSDDDALKRHEVRLISLIHRYALFLKRKCIPFQVAELKTTKTTTVRPSNGVFNVKTLSILFGWIFEIQPFRNTMWIVMEN